MTNPLPQSDIEVSHKRLSIFGGYLMIITHKPSGIMVSGEGRNLYLLTEGLKRQLSSKVIRWEMDRI